MYPLFFFLETILNFIRVLVLMKEAFLTNLLSNLKWENKPPPPSELNYVKNAPIFKTTTQNKKKQHSA